MAISLEHVKEIQRQTIDLGELILAINPVTEKEWDAFEKLVGAHKNLMKVDSDALLQLPLPLEGAVKKSHPRKDCPLCKGKGKMSQPSDSPDLPPRPCTCRDVPESDWPAVKREWKEALQPVKVA